jgi:hypothetical protein
MSSSRKLRDNDVYEYGREHTTDNRRYRPRSTLFKAANQARADIRLDAPVPVEFSSSVFAFLFGQPKFAYSETPVIPDKLEEAEVYHEVPAEAKKSIDSFEIAIDKLDSVALQFHEISTKIRSPSFDHTSDDSIPDEYKKSDLDRSNEKINLEVIDSLSDQSDLIPSMLEINISDDNKPVSVIGPLIERHHTEEELESIFQQPSSIDSKIEITDTKERSTLVEPAATYSQSLNLVERKRDLLYGVLGEFKENTYKQEKKNFLERLPVKKTQTSVFDYYDLSDHQIDYINKILFIRDNVLPQPKSFKRFPVVYIPSGGGKTTLKHTSRYPEEFFDQDDLVYYNYDKFLMFQEFLRKNSLDIGIMENWFVYEIHHNYDAIVANKIVLVSNPRMVPSYFRNYFNELVIIPAQLNWNIRFFRKDFFSLLALNSKPKILSDYSDYENVILTCFDSYLSAVDVH